MSEPALEIFYDYSPERTAIRGYRSGDLTQHQILAAGYALAEQVGTQKTLLNLCESRAHFLIGLIAALKSESVMLLPVSRHEQDLKEARAAYGSAITLVDEALEVDALTIDVSGFLGGSEFPVENLAVSCMQPLAVAFTSGSTGTPQMHTKTWGVLANTARRLAERFRLSPKQTLVGTVPAQHMYGLEMSVVAGLQSGAALFDSTPFYPKDIATACRGADQSMLVTTPVHLRALEGSSATQPSLYGVISATAPLSAELAAAGERMFDCQVSEIYGCTEAGSIATRITTESSDWGLLEGLSFVAQAPPTLEVPFIAEPVPLNDQIKVSGRTFELTGRNDDTINVAGKRFSLAALNQAILALPEVEDAVVFMPEDTAHGRPAALAVSQLSSREIARLLALKVNATFIPRPILKVDRIPRNATGKAERRELLAMLEVLS